MGESDEVVRTSADPRIYGAPATGRRGIATMKPASRGV